MSAKEAFSVIAIIITFISFFPYIRSIIKQDIKPHMISWVIWSILTITVFFAQLADKGGTGAWPTGVSGLITIFIAILAYKKRADASITRMDWLYLGLAVSALPIWYATSNPLWAVIILTLVELLGFIPTFQKAYDRPYEEQSQFFALMAVRNFLSIAALENYSMITVLWPMVAAIACVMLVAVILLRRRIITAE